MAQLAGTVTGFFLFDVGDEIDLARARAAVSSAVPAQLTAKATTLPYVQYVQPPLEMDGSTVGVQDIHGFRVRLKAFDYGVVSVALTCPAPSSWDGLLESGLRGYEDATLAADTEHACRQLVDALGEAITRRRAQFLAEDYWVFVLTHVQGATTAEQVLEHHGDELAQLLRGEREPLSTQEREEVFRHRLSYFTNDVVVPTWNGAFVYDTETGALAALEILEFANSQLLQYRYYDQLLGSELGRIYARLQHPSWWHTWGGRRHTRAARHVHTLFIDVNELTDKTENSLTIAGDVYAARLFGLVAARLALDQWKGNVRRKLETLDDIHRFTVEQTSMARGEFLELAIVLILVFELILFFAGIMR